MKVLRGWVWLVLIGAALLAAPALQADPPPGPDAPVASEEVAPDAEGAQAADDSLTSARLDELLLSRPTTLFVMVLMRLLPVLIGLVLVILWFVKQGEIRAGILPAPEPVSPPLVLPVALSLGLPLLCLFLMPALLANILVMARGGGTDTLTNLDKILVLFVPAAPLALLGAMRHRRLSTPNPPRFRRAFVIGGWALCAVQLAAVPIALGWTFALKAMGHEPMPQKLVNEVIHAPELSTPLLIATYGVLVAPFIEETVFRGMIYPALRQAFGGAKRGIWPAILVTSALFAAVHPNLPAMLPLFGLAVVLNLIYEKTNSLAGSIIAHALFNFSTLVPLMFLRGGA